VLQPSDHLRGLLWTRVVRIKSFPCAVTGAGDNSGLRATKLLAQEESKMSGFTK